MALQERRGAAYAESLAALRELIRPGIERLAAHLKKARAIVAAKQAEHDEKKAQILEAL